MRMILGFAVSLLLTAPLSAAPASGAAKSKSAEEKPKGKGGAACLAEHLQELSDVCRTFMMEREEKQEKSREHLQKVCGKEIEASCKAAATPADIRKCLLENAGKLEGKCAKWAERAREKEPKPGEKKPNKLKEACQADLDKFCPRKAGQAKPGKP